MDSRWVRFVIFFHFNISSMYSFLCVILPPIQPIILSVRAFSSLSFHKKIIFLDPIYPSLWLPIVAPSPSPSTSSISSRGPMFSSLAPGQILAFLGFLIFPWFPLQLSTCFPSTISASLASGQSVYAHALCICVGFPRKRFRHSRGVGFSRGQSRDGRAGRRTLTPPRCCEAAARGS